LDTERVKNILGRLTLFSAILLPLLIHFLGTFGIGLYGMSENASVLAVSFLQSILEVLAAFAMYLFSGCLLFSVLLLGQKESGTASLLGLLRIVLVYLSGLAVQFILNENFADVAAAYIKDVVIANILIDLLLLLATVLIALLFRRGKREDALSRPLRGLFDLSHPAVGGLLALLAFLFLVSLALTLIGIGDALSTLTEEERVLLTAADYLLLGEPILHLLAKAVCGYFLNLTLLSCLLAPRKEVEKEA